MGKGKYGGKYPTFDASGYYGRHDAGQYPIFKPKDYGKKSEIGTGSRSYTFYNKTKGTLTVWANSYKEAWRIAKERGYSRRRFKR